MIEKHFPPLAMIERHRRLNQLLAVEFANGLHALSLPTWTPQEWIAKDEVLPESSPGLGGTKVQSLGFMRAQF